MRRKKLAPEINKKRLERAQKLLNDGVSTNRIKEITAKEYGVAIGNATLTRCRARLNLEAKMRAAANRPEQGKKSVPGDDVAIRLVDPVAVFWNRPPVAMTLKALVTFMRECHIGTLLVSSTGDCRAFDSTGREG